MADLAAYRRFLTERLLDLPLVREVRSNIAIQALKAAAPLHLGGRGDDDAHRVATPRIPRLANRASRL